MKRVRRWVLILGLAGPSVMVPACTTAFLQAARDGAIAGVGIFTQDLAVAFLEGLNLVDGEQP